MISRIFSLSLVACITTPLICMELTPEHLEQKQKLIQNLIQKNEEKIKKYIQSTGIIDRDKEILDLSNKFITIQHHVNAEYTTLFADIEKKYHIDYHSYQHIQNVAHQSALYNEKNENIKKETIKKIEISDIQRDSPMPLDLLFMLQKHMFKNEIYPCVVRFNYINNLNCAHGGHCSSHITTAGLSCVVEHYVLNLKITNPGCITINGDFFETLTPEAKEGFCITLLNQFKHQVNSSLFFLMTDACVKNDLNENDFIQYSQAIEPLSLLTQASKSSHNAHLLKIFLSEMCDPRISDDRYKKLFKIDRLYRILVWLKKEQK